MEANSSGAYGFRFLALLAPMPDRVRRTVAGAVTPLTALGALPANSTGASPLTAWDGSLWPRRRGRARKKLTWRPMALVMTKARGCARRARTAATRRGLRMTNPKLRPVIRPPDPSRAPPI